MAAAQGQPLDFRVKLYCGQMMVTGRVAPSDWWYQVTQAGRKAELVAESGKRRGLSAKRDPADVDREAAQFESALTVARGAEPADVDELTLVDARIYPADFNESTKSGGQTLPIARLPLTSIDLWWIVDGDILRKTSDSGASWGLIFPFPIGN
jgi:hypothetical protein